ncbi:MAG: coenzyme F420-0:L-glutamate ligase, partial [Candidatus Thorarchaeota archaeon]
MHVYPIKTRIITEHDEILDVLLESMQDSGLELEDNDILAIAETPLGTTEGQIVNLSTVVVSEEARALARKYEMIPEVAELVLREADEILGGIPHVLLT